MHYGKAVWVGHLKVGDVVRAVRYTTMDRKAGIPPLELFLMDGTKKVIEQSRGKVPPEVGGKEDFRQGYDIYTVTHINDELVTMVRPYVLLNPDGTIETLGIETQNFQRQSYYYWWELLKG